MNAKDVQELKKRILAMRQERGRLVEANRVAVTQEAAEGEERRSLTAEELAAVRGRFTRIDALDAELAAMERIEAEASDLELPLRGRVADAGEAGRDNGRAGPFRTMGEQLMAVARASIPGQGIDPRLVPFREPAESAATGMNEGTPSDGGFMLQANFGGPIIQRMYADGVLMGRVRHLPITVGNRTTILAIDEDSRASGSRWGGVLGHWMGEGGTANPSKPKLREVDFKLKKLGAFAYVTDELLADAAQVEALVMDLVPKELRFLTEEAIIRGGGAGRPQGFLNSPARITQAKEAGQAAATIVYENIVNGYSRAYGESRSSGLWVYNQDIEPSLFTLGITLGVAGFPVWMPPNGAAGRPNSTLMGNEMLRSEHASTLGTEGDLMFFEPQEYVLAEKGNGGIEMASSIHVTFLTGEQCFRFIYRCDGQLMWKAPLTPAQSAITQSPVVTIATRA